MEESTYDLRITCEHGSRTVSVNVFIYRPMNLKRYSSAAISGHCSGYINKKTTIILNIDINRVH